MTIITSQTGYVPTVYQPKQISQQTTAARETSVNSRADKETDHSTVRPLRDAFINQFNKVAGNDEEAENLLRSWSKPDNGGILHAALPDLKMPDSMSRFNRINQQFISENENLDRQKTDLISQGRAMGKKPQEILKDVFDLFDSQSDLYKLGRGWNGDVFAFDKSSPAGYERMLSFSSDVIDIKG